jgi:hypothetical protein
MKKLSMHDHATQNRLPRILARHLARELTKDDLAIIAGGLPPATTSSGWSSSGAGAGDDGGGDD